MDTALALADRQTDVEALYRADADRLWRAIYVFAGDAEIARDAVAEAYAQLIRRRSAVLDPAAWVWRTAFQISRGELKARRDALNATPSAVDHLDRYADPDLLAALRKLPDGQRAALILFYYLDLPTREIADRLGTNILSVRANLSRGRRRLKTLLGDRDG
jgi:RNA polymerase sigma factor (sigma-70 family)